MVHQDPAVSKANNLMLPLQVEALVDRASIVQAALGDHHSVFLDADGALWSCGENREVQPSQTPRHITCYMLFHMCDRSSACLSC